MKKLPDETSGSETIEAAALLASLTEFSTRAGHDLVGPLNQAGSLLSLFVKRYRNQLDSEANELLDFMQAASTRMEEAVAATRMYMEIAARPLVLEMVDLNTALESALVSLKREIGESGASVNAELLPAVPADAAQTAAIFRILIANAIKFRRPDLAPTVRVSIERAGDIPFVSVEDDGIGIDPEYREAVFLPFRKLHGATYRGAGLGLATARMIVRKHNGAIRIDCDKSRGTRVLFTVSAG
jgi:light-regulated signal transduction histidine kinase (bacteriophytochrome)